MQQQSISEFSKCVGGPCPLHTSCTRFTTPTSQPPVWQPYYQIIPFRPDLNSCEMYIEQGNS